MLIIKSQIDTRCAYWKRVTRIFCYNIIMKELAVRLKELRHAKKLKQNDVSFDLGISITCYAGYEQGYREPNLDTLKQLAIYFGVSTDYLLGLEDDAGNRPHIKP